MMAIRSELHKREFSGRRGDWRAQPARTWFLGNIAETLAIAWRKLNDRPFGRSGGSTADQDWFMGFLPPEVPGCGQRCGGLEEEAVHRKSDQI